MVSFDVNFSQLKKKKVKFLTNLTYANIEFNYLEESKNFVHVQPKIGKKNSNEFFPVEYNYINLMITNKLCELAGFEYFHSVYHMKFVPGTTRCLYFENFSPKNPLM